MNCVACSMAFVPWELLVLGYIQRCEMCGGQLECMDDDHDDWDPTDYGFHTTQGQGFPTATDSTDHGFPAPEEGHEQEGSPTQEGNDDDLVE